MFKLKPLAALVPMLAGIGLGAHAADTGDAPVSYGLATHIVVSGAPYLGAVAPDNNDPVNSPQADADDNLAGSDGTVSDDEDGVFAHPVLVQNAKGYDTNVFANNPGSQPANIVGWIDFDGSGSFDSDEASVATVPAGASDFKVKLVWPDLTGLSTDYAGTTFARFRITSGSISTGNAVADLADGEVEDYAFPILLDSDGDEIPNGSDLDNDNDGIPDSVEGTTTDTDSDGVMNFLDVDSDNDTIPDYQEAGANAANPVDTDNDGVPDYLDLDSNNDNVPDSDGVAGDADGDGITDALEGTGDADGDGILNSADIDSDNDAIPDAVEAGNNPASPVDTDGDGVLDYLDIDSDNDGIFDIRESSIFEINVNNLDADNNGRIDATNVFGTNGYADSIETSADSGIPIYAVPDYEADGVRDFRDTDSDNDGEFDITEVGGVDSDSNGVVDGTSDANADGFVDDTLNTLISTGVFPDTDGDTIPDFRDDVAGGSTDGGSTTGGTGGNLPVIETGLNGIAGCTIGNGSTRDPLLPGLAIAGAFLLWLRRKPARLQRIKIKHNRRL